MEYVNLGKTGLKVSRIAMGGHEYLQDGRSRGFNEDREKSLTPGALFDGFGGENRKAVLKTAYENGINFFEVTQDSEKEALGRNLRECPPPYEVYIQTRPERMAYSYDKYNLGMADLNKLRTEVQRILKLMQIERLDFLNCPPMKWAFDHDPDYLDKLGYNLGQLKKEGLLRYAAADTFSGEEIYRKMIESGVFDVIYVNFNFGDHTPMETLKLAKEKGMGVVTREVYMKGDLFKMAKQAGIEDTVSLAEAAMRWQLTCAPVDVVVYGTGKVRNLQTACRALEKPFSAQDEALLEKIRGTEMFKVYEERRRDEFAGKLARMDLLFIDDSQRTYTTI